MANNAALARYLKRRHLSLNSLVEGAEQVVIFGSRATGQAIAGSDWDLLLVGSHPRVFARQLDLIIISKEFCSSERWLHSELANHIASYGIWLAGDTGWKNECSITSGTIDAKVEKIHRRTSFFLQRMHLLSAAYIQKYIKLIRRDLQRFCYLQLQQPVPPSPQLDTEWRSNSKVVHNMFDIANMLHLPNLISEQIAESTTWSVPWQTQKRSEVK